MNPTYEENVKQQIFISDYWYADHYVETYNRFLGLISS